MAKGAGQKRKTLILARVLLERTDEDHTMTVPELITALEAEGVTAERKSVYDDLEALRGLGWTYRAGRGGPRVVHRRAALSAPGAQAAGGRGAVVQIHHPAQERPAHRQAGGLTSVWQARQLQRQVYVDRRVKTMNESVYYSIDTLHAALAEGRGVRFRYFEYNVRKEKVFRREGAWYAVFPHGLIWDDENYYLVGYDEEKGGVRHYRVDKMAGLEITDRTGKEGGGPGALDVAAYAAKHFGMFSGREGRVRLRCENGLVGVVLDRFGQESILVPDGRNHFTVTVDAVVSPQFFGWLFGLGDRVELLAPDWAAAAFRAQLDAVGANYGEKQKD
ncbi:MAG: helix-turn-helix transcriptional regulator [Intestinimonas sp.]